MQPIRRIIEVADNLGSKTDNETFYITRECGHVKTVNKDTYEFSICHECPPLSDNWNGFDSYRGEWYCRCGVGHRDPRLNKDTTHGCCGKNCCSRQDFPGRDYEKSNLHHR